MHARLARIPDLMTNYLLACVVLAVVFGVVEMVTIAGLARYFSTGEPPETGEGAG